MVAEGRKVIANVERVANLFVTKSVYAAVLAFAVGLTNQQFPFFPRHLTIISSLTIGIPAFFLALAPNDRRAEPGLRPTGRPVLDPRRDRRRRRHLRSASTSSTTPACPSSRPARRR